jgi:hypothetical protein
MPSAWSPADWSIHPGIARAFASLGRSGIGWALLRGEAELDSSEGDVDILVARPDLPRLEQALAPLGYGRLPSHGRGSHTFFLTYDKSGDSWVKLDVVTELSFGRYQELRLEGAAGCLARRRVVAGAVVLDRGDGFWALLLHCLLDGSGFSDASRRALSSLVAHARTTDALALALESVLSRRWRPEALIALAEAGDWATLELAAPAMRADWLRSQRLGSTARLIRNAVMRRLGRVPPLRRPGLIVGVTVADAGLAAAVVNRWFLPHRWVRLGESYASLTWNLARAGWHSALGRLVVVEQSAAGEARQRGHLFAGRRLPPGPFASLTPAEATAELWQRYVGGSAR